MNEDLTPLAVVEPKKKPVLLIILVALLLSSLSLSAFLFYQNLQFQRQIAKLSVQPIPIPSLVIDPTANWKTYSDNQYNFVFDYPESWKIDSGVSEPKPQDITIMFDPDTLDAYLERNPSGFDQSQKSNTIMNGIKMTRIKNKDVYSREYAVLSLANGTLIIMGTLDLKTNQNQIATFDQILSTFKFTE